MSEAAARKKPETGALELTYERLFEAPRAKVFEAWTNPAILAKWWGPKSFTTPTVELDLREGGRWTTTMRAPSGEDHVVAGTYTRIEPPRRLSFTWAWVQGGEHGHQTTVDVEFEERGAQTLMRFRQGAFESAEAVAQHDHGWTSTWEGFEEFVAAGGLA